MKNVCIVSASPRKNSNSARLADAFAEGARAAGHNVTAYSLAGKNIGFCRGCGACHTTHTCVQKDDAGEIVTALAAADVVVFATPVYYYSMPGQLKTLLDRTLPHYATEYAFREVYLLATAEDTDNCTFDGTITMLMGWVSCFPNARLAGLVRGYGVNAPGDIGKHLNYIKEALTLGKQLS